jgi:hypothetical protein
MTKRTAVALALLLLVACSSGPVCVLEPMCWRSPDPEQACIPVSEICRREPVRDIGPLS